MAYDLLTNPAVFSVVISLCAYLLYGRLTYRSTLPADLPWVGCSSGSLSRIKGRLLSNWKGQTLLKQVYDQYASKGLSCLYPSTLGEGHVLLPPSKVNWLVEQPDDVLSVHQLLCDVFQLDYTLMSPEVTRNPTQTYIIKRDLTRQVGPLIGELMDEVQRSFDDIWGLETDHWREVPIHKTVQKIIARSSYRVFVGAPICRNEEFIQNVIKYAHDIPISAMVLRFFPGFVRPVIAPAVTFLTRWHYWQTAKHAVPLIRERIASIKEKEGNPKSTYKEPNDFITWNIRASQKMSDPYERTPDMIWTRLIAVGFVSLHTTSFTMTNVLIDLASSPPERGYLEGIREEVTRVLAEEGGQWTKAGLARMVRTDSAIRESMRVSGISAYGPSRQVVAEKGLTTNEGVHLPKGANVGIVSWFFSHDEKAFENADDYDAFRFSRAREEVDPTTIGSDETAQGNHMSKSANDGRAEVLKNKNLSLVTTSETFLQFGYGRHSCPGRFFAAAELKLMVAYMVLHYEIQPMPKKPPLTWFGESVLPSFTATISMRRRKITATI